MLEPIIWRLKLFWSNPASAKYAFNRRFYNLTAPFRRGKRVKCNICEWEGHSFSPIAGANYIRYNALCPSCGSTERNRALMEYMNISGDFNDKGAKYLEIGPFKGSRAYFEKRSGDYVSIDIDSEDAMMKMDIAKLEFPENSFDIIICSHVLEHVEDDIKAMREMHRVLNKRGKCYVMVPFNPNQKNTIEYEKPNPLDPSHVRNYGMDVLDRIESAGFKVSKIDLVAALNKDDARRYGLGTEEICFLGAKNDAGAN